MHTEEVQCTNYKDIILNFAVVLVSYVTVEIYVLPLI